MHNTYRIITYGCQMNVHESEKIAGMLEEQGYCLAAETETPDVVVLNTCCVRESAETRVLGNLGILKKAKEQHAAMKIVVCGCMTQADGAAQRLQARCPFLHAVLGTHNIYRLPEVLARPAGKTYIEIGNDTAIREDIPIARTSGINAWVNIMYGCNNFCTYCIVPYVRGRERSRERKHILADIRRLVQDGYKQITLLGQNVNSYGADLTEKHSFASLLQEISAIDGKFRVKFMTSHPKDILPETIDAIAQSDKMSHFIHMPAQSGSDRILQSMHRHYTASEYLRKIDMIRNKIPDAGLSGDMMVGFPTETEADFADTMQLTERVRYNNLYTFIYSKRSGTPAAVMDGQVPIAEKKQRIRRLIDLQFAIGNALAAESVGKTYTVLCTEYKNGKCIGETNCGKAVVFAGEQNLVGQFFSVKITQNKNSKLYGERL
ncbi:MAG: tRNA (N6-isopentenyl adenosine(37)-C2)-methylthiotransferase MiaB [Clostridia bacterium]|jgi:tRNA-2-methylthio-N6-dimethylallyladenosine synthase|nr:tRNA (N6-isopentenyl adenosine(37)-C2)-methylthiotransferase MiaB [Clostridia bacterium]